MVAGTERVDVQSRADANIAESRKLLTIRAQKILRRRELDVPGVAFEHTDLHAGPFGQGSIVGEVLAALGCRATQCVQQGRKRNACGVCTSRIVLRSSRFNGASCINALDGVGYRQRRDGCTGLFCRHYGARDQACAGEGPGRVVYEHNVGSMRL